MTASTLTYVGTLKIVSCWCGIQHAIPSDLDAKALRDHRQNVYCPLGHSWVYMGETEAEKLARQLKYSQDHAATLLAERDQAEASRRAWKGHVTRLRNRAIEGDCPLCGQHLRDLARHMGRIHPGEQAELPEAEAGS